MTLFIFIHPHLKNLLIKILLNSKGTWFNPLRRLFKNKILYEFFLNS